VHSLVRRFIKTAIVFLALGLGIVGWVLVRRELWSEFPNQYLVSAHTHAVFVGFVMMMICGVALWLFPRPEKADARYRPALAETAYWLLTAATTTRVFGELMRAAVSASWLRWLVVAAGLCQIAAMGLFVHTMWVAHQSTGQSSARRKGRALLREFLLPEARPRRNICIRPLNQFSRTRS
jgi:heme/copper-type cytochrome/quinol oxidase subunit 1